MAKQPTFNDTMRMVILHGKEPFLMKRYTDDLEKVLVEKFGEVDRVVFDGVGRLVAGARPSFLAWLADAALGNCRRGSGLFGTRLDPLLFCVG